MLGGRVVIGSSPGGGVVVEARFGTAAALGDRDKFPMYAGTRPGKTSNH
jgi:hypothetical protein